MSSQTVLQFFHSVSAKQRGLNASTIQLYSSELRMLDKMAGHEVTVDELNEVMVNNLTDWVRSQGLTYNYGRQCSAVAGKVLCDIAERQLRDTLTPEPSPSWPLLLFLRDVYLVERRIKLCTSARYDRAIRTFGEFVGHPIRLEELSDHLASKWVLWLEAGGASPKTCHSFRRDVLTVWRRAAKHKLCDPPSDDIRTVKLPRPNPDAWSIEEVRKILATCDRMTGFFKNGIPKSKYLRLLIETAYQTGLRRGDLLRLTVSDVNDDGVISTLMGKTLDGHISTLESETRELFMGMAQRLKEDGDPLWEQPLHWPTNERTLYALLHKVRRMAGVKTSGALQKLRRTGATYVEKQYPGAAMRFLGHRTPGLAYRHYVDRSKLGPPPRPPALSLK